MKYADSAPRILVEGHKAQINDLRRPPHTISGDDPEEYVLWQGELKPAFYLWSILPGEESTALLGRLTTDPRMKDAWNPLASRVKGEAEYVQFFRTCERGINGWRNSPKQRPAEQKADLQKIADGAVELRDRLDASPQFSQYAMHELIDDREITHSLDFSHGTSNVLNGRLAISSVLPSISVILTDVSRRAAEYAGEEPIVNKPHSANADLHFFIRVLSNYLNQKYGQPLHEVVAVTADVVFDRKEIDSDYVRMLVS